MQRFKVNKGINKKIRFLGMESEFAQQYLIALSSYWLVVFTLFGSTKTFLLFGIIGIFIIDFYADSRTQIFCLIILALIVYINKVTL